MSYANPIHVSYTFATAVSNTAWTVAPPMGKTQCRVVGINASVTTTYNAVTTPAVFKVGVPSNLAVAGSLDFGTTAAGSSVGLVKTSTNPLIPMIDLSGTANPSAISTAQPAIEALGPVTFTFTANTGGSPVGAAVVTVTLAWF